MVTYNILMSQLPDDIGTGSGEGDEKKISISEPKRGRPRKQKTSGTSAGGTGGSGGTSGGGGHGGKPRTMPADDDLDRLDMICDAYATRQKHKRSDNGAKREQLSVEEQWYNALLAAEDMERGGLKPRPLKRNCIITGLDMVSNVNVITVSDDDEGVAGAWTSKGKAQRHRNNKRASHQNSSSSQQQKKQRQDSNDANHNDENKNVTTEHKTKTQQAQKQDGEQVVPTKTPVEEADDNDDDDDMMDAEEEDEDEGTHCTSGDVYDIVTNYGSLYAQMAASSKPLYKDGLQHQQQQTQQRTVVQFAEDHYRAASNTDGASSRKASSLSSSSTNSTSSPVLPASASTTSSTGGMHGSVASAASLSSTNSSVRSTRSSITQRIYLADPALSSASRASSTTSSNNHKQQQQDDNRESSSNQHNMRTQSSSISESSSTNGRESKCEETVDVVRRQTWKDCLVFPPITFEQALGDFSNKARVVVNAKSPFQIMHCNAAYSSLTGNDSSVIIGKPYIGGDRITATIKAKCKTPPGIISKKIHVVKAFAINPSQLNHSQDVRKEGSFDYFLLEIDEATPPPQASPVSNESQQQQAQAVAQAAVALKRSGGSSNSLLFDADFNDQLLQEYVENEIEETMWLDDSGFSMFSVG
mmetsp:Transcript_21965/g.33533  ORF Transcript_21965/g.33533 Transcript_21965/m.33533 type:complete len:643 (-) Transcript_21965:19-1947(-)